MKDSTKKYIDEQIAGLGSQDFKISELVSRECYRNLEAVVRLVERCDKLEKQVQSLTAGCINQDAVIFELTNRVAYLETLCEGIQERLTELGKSGVSVNVVDSTGCVLGKATRY